MVSDVIKDIILLPYVIKAATFVTYTVHYSTAVLYSTVHRVLCQY